MLVFLEPSAAKDGGPQHSDLKCSLSPPLFSMVYLLPSGLVVSQVKDLLFLSFPECKPLEFAWGGKREVPQNAREGSINQLYPLSSHLLLRCGVDQEMWQDGTYSSSPGHYLNIVMD